MRLMCCRCYELVEERGYKNDISTVSELNEDFESFEIYLFSDHRAPVLPLVLEYNEDRRTNHNFYMNIPVI